MPFFGGAIHLRTSSCFVSDMPGDMTFFRSSPNEVDYSKWPLHYYRVLASAVSIFGRVARQKAIVVVVVVVGIREERGLLGGEPRGKCEEGWVWRRRY